MSLKIPTGKDLQTHLLLKCLEVDIKMEGKKKKKKRGKKKEPSAPGSRRLISRFPLRNSTTE